MTETHAPYTVGEMAETAEKTMLLNGDRDQLRTYLRELADLVGLRDWTINVLETPPSNPEHAASIDVRYGRKYVNIDFLPEWASWPAEDLRQTCVHELLHCHINHVRWPINNIQELVGHAIYTPLYESVTDYIEYAVDAIASEWAKTLPLPIRDVAPAAEVA
jgi:hypothetical protein